MLKKLPEITISKPNALLILASVAGTILLQKSIVFCRKCRRQGLKSVLKKFGFRLLSGLGSVKTKIKSEDQAARKSFEEHFNALTLEKLTDLPQLGDASCIEVLKLRSLKDASLRHVSKLSGSIYHNSGQILQAANEAMQLYTYGNPLHPDVFPSLRQIECEIVSMTVELFRGGPQACGVVTSGGTESLMLMMLGYREWGRSKGIYDPEVIASTTVHPSVNKAAHYFGINLIQLKPDSVTKKLRPNDVRKTISSYTVAIIASAPDYPYGIMDPVEDLAKLALRYKINLHVDSCLGSLMIPFARKAGFDFPATDFSVPGVTSISCDIHKYGFSPKGISVLMHSDEGLRRNQFFTCADWPGGMYATPTMAGSRPGVLSAGAWAVMKTLGQNGYLEAAQKIMGAARYIKANCKYPELSIIGDPLLSVIAFTSSTMNAHHIGSALKKVGHWDVNLLQDPPGFHICVTLANCESAEEFVCDVGKAIEIAKANPEAFNTGMVALYGAAAAVPDTSIVGDITKNYLDFMFSFSK